jgi:signal transduction histidine kinase
MNRLTFRQKLLLTYAACALTLMFITFVGVGLYINTLQKTNVEDAVKLAEEQAHNMALAVSDIMNAHGNTDFRDPGVQAGLRAVTRVNLSLNKSILYAAIISPDGDRYVEEVGEKGRQYYLERDGESVTKSDLQLPGGNTLTVQVQAQPEGVTDISTPIRMEGNKQGKIQLKLEESGTYQRIEASSQRITRILIFGCMLMLIFLLGIFLILWKMFFRHLELQEKNARLDQMAYVGTLASGLAHEIRNPLSAMNVNLEVIREELAEVPDEIAGHTSELSRRVQDEVTRLNSTLTNFLDFALPRKEGYSQFPLRGLVEDLLEIYAEQMKAHGITFELESPPAPSTTVEADRHLLHRAIRNILVNAIQILSGSVKKSIRLQISQRPKDHILLAISDSGPGIPATDLARIFDVFYTTRKGGSGFGLAIARKILQEHQGRLWAENNSDSLGATFYLELPRFAPQEEQAEVNQKFWRRPGDRKDLNA